MTAQQGTYGAVPNNANALIDSTGATGVNTATSRRVASWLSLLFVFLVSVTATVLYLTTDETNNLEAETPSSAASLAGPGNAICTLKGSLWVAAAAAFVVVALPVVVCCSCIGLGPSGPIAGGWFAANTGAALASGGFMASMQSCVAGTSASVIAAISASGAAGGLAGWFLTCTA